MSDRRADGSEYLAHIPRTVQEAGCTISLAVAKTHDVQLTTLAYKNMVMGALRKEDRVKMHGYNSHGEREMPREAQVLIAMASDGVRRKSNTKTRRHGEEHGVPALTGMDRMDRTGPN